MMNSIITSYVNGKWESGGQSPLIELRNPANIEEVVGKVAYAEQSAVTRAVEAAHQAWDSWRRTALEKRIHLVASFLSEIEHRRNDLAEIITLENGKTLAESQAEITSSLNEGHFQLNYLQEKLPEEKTGTVATRYEPLGVVVLLTPWNFPLATIIRKLIPALLTGNTFVVKPSEYTPMTDWFLFNLLHQLPVPPGVINLILGDGPTVGAQLVNDARIAAISLTGSTNTGQAISRLLIDRDLRFQAEMGGSNAEVILADADLEAAVEAVLSSGFACCGQWCTGTTRVIVEAPVYADVLEMLQMRANNIVVGDGRHPDTTMGPLISESRLDHICTIVAEALKQGARLIYGGKSPAGLPPGYFFEPTILADVQVEMPFVQREIFGPVLVVMPVKNSEEALEVTNNSPFGLSFSIYTRNREIAEYFLQEVQAGMCHINLPTGYRDPALPVWGWKASGYGWAEAGRFALDFFTQPKAIYRNIS